MIRLPCLLPALVLLTCSQTAQSAAPDFSVLLWNRTIPYTIDNKFSEADKGAIRALTKIFEANTCLTYKEDNGPGFKLEFEHLDQGTQPPCNAEVGRIKNRNSKVSVTPGCIYGIGFPHEMIHSLGFQHTECRHDRDNYVIVAADAAKNDVNYQKVSTSETYGIPYDFTSIMHSSPSAKMKVIDPDNLSSMIGFNMSWNDWKAINMHYKCNETCAPETKCHNGGYQDPHDCTKCICPRHFFKGPHCEDVVDVINIIPGHTEVQNYRWKVSSDPNVRRVAYVMKAPEGTRIRTTIVDIVEPFSEGFGEPHNCNGNSDGFGLEVVEEDLTIDGKRFCSISKKGYSFLSKTNVIGYTVFAHNAMNFYTNVTFAVEGSPVVPATTTTLSPTTQNPTTSTTTTTLNPMTTATTAKPSSDACEIP